MKNLIIYNPESVDTYRFVRTIRENIGGDVFFSYANYIAKSEGSFIRRMIRNKKKEFSNFVVGDLTKYDAENGKDNLSNVYIYVFENAGYKKHEIRCEITEIDRTFLVNLRNEIAILDFEEDYELADKETQHLITKEVRDFCEVYFNLSLNSFLN